MDHILNTLLPREKECTVDTCPVSESIYGYAPSGPVTIFFVAAFGLFGFAHLAVGWRFRFWTFMFAMATGCILEAFGYVGRYMLHNDPFDDAGFKLQICLLTFAPAFLAAGIYLMLKQLVIAFGEHFSRIRPNWYTYIFITCDVISLLLQGAGGGLASAGDPGSAILDAGNDTMIAGLIFQVITLGIFAIFASEYFIRVYQHRHDLNPETTQLRRSLKFRLFLAALFLAWLTIFIRCIYRVVEMIGGWGNSIMQDELLFNILDAVMCLIASGALLIMHPGFTFNFRVINADRINNEKSGDTSSSELSGPPMAV